MSKIKDESSFGTTEEKNPYNTKFKFQLKQIIYRKVSNKIKIRIICALLKFIVIFLKTNMLKYANILQLTFINNT